MYAIIETGGKQYRVSAGDKLRLEKIHAEEGEQVSFDKVILLGKDDGPLIGTPYIDGAVVTAKILEHGKDDKVIVFKYRRKKNYRKFRGHRQQYTLFEFDGIKG
ncbi:MAG: 50S ribosomal protein L21 [Synergistaceae bacterium]|jgi:large subunit ribosomal protein L21|nr:50S ribosomal protein L21 [Synergistaceae bacterium]